MSLEVVASTPLSQPVQASELTLLQVQELLQRLGAAEQQISTQAQQLAAQSQELTFRQSRIDALIQEIRLLRHQRFAAKSEQMDSKQRQLFEEANAEDLAAAEQQLANLGVKPARTGSAPQVPRRQALPAHLPRVDIHHEPADTHCGCGQEMVRISQDVSERLDYVPGEFQVERHIRGVYKCMCCNRLQQEPMPAQLIESGLPTPRLLAHVLVSKHDDHLPLYRQSEIFARSKVHIAVSTLADWAGKGGGSLIPLVDALKVDLLQMPVLHADETRLQILRNKGESQHGYVWAYASTKGSQAPIVIYDVQPGRGGKYPKAFLSTAQPRIGGAQDPPIRWQGHLVVDDYAGYKHLFEDPSAPVVEVGCWAHVRRKFFELHVATQSPLAQRALEQIGQLYDVERQISDGDLNDEHITQLRQREALPRLQAFEAWLRAQREQVLDGSTTAKAMDYALKRWPSLVRYASDARLPIDNNRVENLIRPWALGRKNWLFAGSLAAAQRAGAIMSLIETARLNGHNPLAYLTDVFERLPTHPNSRIAELLPTHWQPRTTN